MQQILLLIIVVLLTLSSPLNAASAIKEPVFIVGQDKNSIKHFINKLNKETDIDGIMVYIAINDLRGLDTPVDHGAGINHADALLKQYPSLKIVQIGLYMKYMLKEVINGNLDNNIIKLGNWINNSGKDVYLRIGYEFDNPDNEYAPHDYIKAYQHIVDILKRNKIHNVHFVWHSIAWKDTNWPTFEPLNWYPGDDYVDWIGISYFDATRKIERNTIATIAKIKNKPLMIAESSPFKQYTIQSKHEWLKSVFDFIKTYNVRFLSYINVNWNELALFKDNNWGDSRLESNKALLKELLDGINNFKSNVDKAKP